MRALRERLLWCLLAGAACLGWLSERRNHEATSAELAELRAQDGLPRCTVCRACSGVQYTDEAPDPRTWRELFEEAAR